MVRWPQNELLARLVGEEDPHELMRDGGEPPICGSLKPDHCGEVHATRNLAGKEKAGKRCGGWGQSRQRSQEGRNQKDSGNIYRVIDKQRRRRVTFLLDF